ncbi:MAG: hypothetical protein JWP91_2224 [Fibrobacteres bacterium]|nr:hypothetical protein [Fibrobacterota bacterium]
MTTESPGRGRNRFRIPPFVQHLLKFAVGGGAIWALIHFGALDPALVGQAFLKHPLLCLGAFLSYLFLVVAAAWMRWFLLLRQAGLRVGAGRVFSLQMIGIFFNSLIPGGTGGDLIKGYYLYKEHEDKDQSLALTSIAMDRFVGLYGLLCVAMAMTVINYDLWKDSPAMRINSIFYACVFLAFTSLIAFFFSPWSSRYLEHPRLHKAPGGRFLKSLSDSLMVYRARPWGLLPPLALGIIVDCGLILLYSFSANSLGLTLPLRVHGFVVPTLTMINGIPISPSGLGTGEAAGEWMYRNLGVAEGGSEVLALVHICILVTSLFGAPFYFLYRIKPGAGKP